MACTAGKLDRKLQEATQEVVQEYNAIFKAGTRDVWHKDASLQIGKQSALGGAAASPKLSIRRCQAGAAAPVWSSYASKTVFTPAWSDLLAAGRQKPATFLHLAGATQGQKLKAPMSDRPSPAPCNVREARLEQVSTSACRHLCNALRHAAQLQSPILGQTAGRGCSLGRCCTVDSWDGTSTMFYTSSPSRAPPLHSREVAIQSATPRMQCRKRALRTRRGEGRQQSWGSKVDGEWDLRGLGCRSASGGLAHGCRSLTGDVQPTRDP